MPYDDTFCLSADDCEELRQQMESLNVAADTAPDVEREPPPPAPIPAVSGSSEEASKLSGKYLEIRFIALFARR